MQIKLLFYISKISCIFLIIVCFSYEGAESRQGVFVFQCNNQRFSSSQFEQCATSNSNQWCFGYSHWKFKYFMSSYGIFSGLSVYFEICLFIIVYLWFFQELFEIVSTYILLPTNIIVYSILR